MLISALRRHLAALLRRFQLCADPGLGQQHHEMALVLGVSRSLDFRMKFMPLVAKSERGCAMRLAFALLIPALLASCSDTADTFPMNAAAKSLGPLKASFVRTGTGRGPITITMGDGEILTGEYRVAFGSSFGMAFSGRQSASALVITNGPMQFVATGPRTQILCRGTSSTMGHGNGQCQTYEGAVWAISW